MLVFTKLSFNLSCGNIRSAAGRLDFSGLFCHKGLVHLKILLFLASALVYSAAAAPAQIPLWPGKPPGEQAELPPEQDLTKATDNLVGGQRLIRLGNVSTPTLAVYPAPTNKANGAAVLVCPGGGYHILALDLEGSEICERLNSMGITAILLKYRVPRRPNQEKHLAPLQDAQRAIRLIRQHAAEWHIDPKRVGVLGFSAGGHLAASASNPPADRTYPRVDAADELDARPNFSVLIYPAYLAREDDKTKVSPELSLSASTPQAFITMTEDDGIGVECALAYSAELKKLKVPFEMHIYPTGGHGYGLRKSKETVTTWPDRLQDWFIARGLDQPAAP